MSVVRRPWFLALVLLLVMAGGTAGAVLSDTDPSGAPDQPDSSSPPGSPAGSSQSPSAAPLTRAPGPIPGYLLIADRGNDRMLLVDGRKHVRWVYPRPGRQASFPFHFDDDAFFGPGFRSVISQQEEQHTIQVISFPEGDVLWHYGHVDRTGSARGYLHTPDDAYLLADGTRTVADVGNCRILFISPNKRIVKQYGTTGDCRHDPPRAC